MRGSKGIQHRVRIHHNSGLKLKLSSMVVKTFDFCGKYFGGRKFWPAVSPKKTWSGTAGGWVAATLTGVVCVLAINLPPDIIWISVFVSMFSQGGDIVESALKRQMKIKDSSQLIPGHGGVFDRFDGMLGAGALCFLVAITWG